MTPTLFGRWQTRLFLLMTFGVVFTIPFIIFSMSVAPLIILLYVMITGFFWDIVYDRLQKVRWDRDWPAVLQVTAGIFEFFAVFIAIFTLWPIGPTPFFGTVFLHYWTVWIVTFIASQSVMRILFPRWRFHGGTIN